MNIHDEFQPDLTPEEMKQLGVLAKQYFDKDPKEHNFFHVDASLNKWPEEWKRDDAPHGWFEWYQHYSAGQRGPDDERQIKRWKSFKARHLAQLLKADPTGEDLNVQPRRRQALLNWGIAPGDKNKYLEKVSKVNKYLEKIASIQLTRMDDGNFWDRRNERIYMSPDNARLRDKELDRMHIGNGAKMFATVGGISGGALGAAFGPKSAFNGKPGVKAALGRGIKGTAIGAGLGAITGALLANAGNGQVHESPTWMRNRRGYNVFDENTGKITEGY